MNATVLDLRRNMKKIFAAIDRNERVSLTYRGRERAVIVPSAEKPAVKSSSKHPAFGIWADRKDMKNVDAYVRNMRKGRF